MPPGRPELHSQRGLMEDQRDGGGIRSVQYPATLHALLDAHLDVSFGQARDHCVEQSSCMLLCLQEARHVYGQRDPKTARMPLHLRNVEER